MKIKKYLLPAALVLAAFAFFPGEAQASMPGVDQEENLLVPGAATFCSHNFTIENKGKSDAEVQMILGNEPVSRENIPLGQTRSYDLKENLSRAMLQGKKVSLKDSAFLLNLTPNSSNLRVYCEE
ncbi:MAG: hypothetical protein HY579_01820 [Nitrospinae bacterium]|nr:hypothetical protein [Nitrospinota bacterium]